VRLTDLSKKILNGFSGQNFDQVLVFRTQWRPYFQRHLSIDIAGLAGVCLNGHVPPPDRPL
jgi:hypothetical protein